MDITTLKNHIKSGEFDKFYIFTGPEIKVQNIYLDHIAKTKSASVKNLDSITELGSKMYVRSFLENRFVYVLRNSKEILSSEDLLDKITQNNAFLDSILILIFDTIDKRTKLYKKYADHIIEFEYMKPATLVKYIQQEISLSPVNCEKLIEVCERDYSRILLEIDKIKTYEKAMSEIVTITYNDCFNDLLKSGAIHTPPRDAVFMFVDAVLNGHPKLAFDLLKESYESGESTLVLLTNLYNGAKFTLQVQSFNGQGKCTDATGLTPFQVKKAYEHKGVYSNGDLVYLMKLIRSAEKGIKTGRIEDEMAVPYVLVNLW